jgi:hypothetical protein
MPWSVSNAASRRLATAVVSLLLGTAAMARHRGSSASGQNDSNSPALGVDALAQAAVVAIHADGKARCSGTLVASNGVLTAKHCVQRRRRIEVVFGSGAERVERRVVGVQLHRTLDAALLVIGDDAPSASHPLHLTRKLDGFVGPSTALLAATAGTSETPRRLLEASVVDLSDELIVRYSDSGLCKGESGAALFGRDASGVAAFVGILRGGVGNCSGPDSFVRADRLAPWVEARCGERCKDSKQVASWESSHEKR